MDWRHTTSAVIPGLEGVALRVLWSAGRPLTSGDVHRAARNASYSGVRYALDRLVSQGVLLAERIGGTTAYRPNVDHLAWPAIEAALDRFDPWADLIRRAEMLVHDEVHPEFRAGITVAVFGSVARGEATQDSDLDLVIVVPDDLPGKVLDALTDRFRVEGEVWTGNAVQVYALRNGDLAAAVRSDDPIVTSWRDDARTLVGRPFLDIIGAAA